MADDPAFVWDSGPAVSSPPRPAPPPATVVGASWVTVREASERTGIPISTIRNWARKERIPSRIDEGEGGRSRLVDLAAVLDRGRRLGRLDPHRDGATTEAVIDLRERREEPATPPEGSLLVPLDAWEKMLVQLGHLHEAGQQLAEARERAARAETEAAFLRERLAEMRERLRAAEAGSPQPPPAPASVPSPPPPTTSRPSRLERFYLRWRAR